MGSANLNPRSRYLNTELGLVVESPELAERVASQFEVIIQPEYSFRLELVKGNSSNPNTSPTDEKIVWVGEENGKEVIYKDEPLAGSWRKFSTGFLSLFAPESLL